MISNLKTNLNKITISHLWGMTFFSREFYDYNFDRALSSFLIYYQNYINKKTGRLDNIIYKILDRQTFNDYTMIYKVAINNDSFYGEQIWKIRFRNN